MNMSDVSKHGRLRQLQDMGDSLTLYEDMTPDPEKSAFHTYAAYTKDMPGCLILKEIDEKRARIYRKLAKHWNPYIGAVYDVRRIAFTEKDSSPVYKNNSSADIDAKSDQFPIYENPLGSAGSAAHNDPEGRAEYLAMLEFVYGPTLLEYVREHGPLPLETALWVLVFLCRAVAPLHHIGIIHRDIKPQNIIVCSQKDCFFEYNEKGSQQKTKRLPIKLIDFGIAEEKVKKKDYASEFGGTSGYRAPESMTSLSSAQSDIYSLCCVLNFMLTGHNPAAGLYKGKHSIEDLILKGIDPDPSYRYSSAETLENVLLHELGAGPWYTRIPFFRHLPGYRSRSLLNEIIASISYSYFIYTEVHVLWSRDYPCFFILLVLWMLLPLTVLFNLCGIMRFLPLRFRRNRRRFLFLKVLVVSLCLAGGALAFVYL